MSGIESHVGTYEHGTRARYVSAKCRCAACRQANREYARQRAEALIAGDNNGLVDASRARAHLEALSRAGVGKRAVSAACDVALSVLQDVRTGLKTHIRARTERRILGVDAGAAADHALVPAKATRRALAALREMGLTKQEIARRLGSEAASPSLQLSRKRVTAINALKVQRLLAEVRESVVCRRCDMSHGEASRLAQLRTFTDDEMASLPKTWACLYGGPKGLEVLLSDLKRLGRMVPVEAGPALTEADLYANPRRPRASAPRRAA